MRKGEFRRHKREGKGGVSDMKREKDRGYLRRGNYRKRGLLEMNIP